MPKTWRRLLSGLTLLALLGTTVPAAAAPRQPLQEEAPSPSSQPTNHPIQVTRPDGSVQLAGHEGAPRVEAPEPILLGPGVTSKLQGAAGLSAATAAVTIGECPPATSRIQLSVSPQQLPFGPDQPVTVTAVGPDGAPVPGLTVTVDGAQEGWVTTDAQGSAQLTYTPWSSGAYRVWAPNSAAPISEALLFVAAPDQSSVALHLSDRCGEPLSGYASGKAPGFDGQYVELPGGLAGFVTTASSSLLIEGSGSAAGLGYQLYTTVGLTPESLTTVNLSGAGIEPTILHANVDGEPTTGIVFLLPAQTTGYSYYIPFDLGEPIILSPGTYAGSIYTGSNYFIDSLAVSGGAQTIEYSAAEFSSIGATATLAGTELAVESLYFRRGPFAYGVGPGTILSNGHFDLYGVQVRHPDGSIGVYQRQSNMPIDLIAGEPVTFDWDLALGAATLSTAPTYRRYEQHRFDWHQPTADGWHLSRVGDAHLSATATNQVTGATLDATGWNLTSVSLFMPGEDLFPFSVEVRRPATAFAPATSLTTIITPVQPKLTASSELIRAGEVSTVSLTLTANGLPLANRQIEYWSPEAPFATQHATTDAAGRITLSLSPAANLLSQYQFWWYEGGDSVFSIVYAAPPGWGLVSASATDQNGLPLPRVEFQGKTGFAGRDDQDGNHYKALLPAGPQPVRLLGLSANHEGYLLTGQVKVPNGGVAQLQLSGAATETLELTATRLPSESVQWQVVPAKFAQAELSYVRDEYVQQPLHVTPGNYWVAPVIRNFEMLTRKLFPAKKVSGGGSVHADSALATTEFRPYGQAATGEVTEFALFSIDTGGGATIRVSSGSDSFRSLMAPGTYSITKALLPFNAGEFQFEGDLPVKIKGQALVEVPFGGTLTGQVLAGTRSYKPGDQIKIRATLKEQNGLTLTKVEGYDPAAIRLPSLTVTGNQPVAPVPLQDGAALWVTETSLQRGTYTLTLTQDLLGYFLLPSAQASVVIQ